MSCYKDPLAFCCIFSFKEEFKTDEPASYNLDKTLCILIAIIPFSLIMTACGQVVRARSKEDVGAYSIYTLLTWPQSRVQAFFELLRLLCSVYGESYTP